MKENDFPPATADDRGRYVTRPYETVPVTVLVEGSNSHLIRGSRVMLSFLTMKAGSVFELHSHPEEQIMVVLEGFCDEIIEDRIYRVGPGDVLVIAKQPAGLGIIHLTLQLASTTLPGARTLFIQNTNLDETAASGALEVE